MGSDGLSRVPHFSGGNGKNTARMANFRGIRQNGAGCSELSLKSVALLQHVEKSQPATQERLPKTSGSAHSGRTGKESSADGQQDRPSRLSRTLTKFIRDRQRAGIKAAKRKGVYRGRKKQVDDERIRQLAAQKVLKAQIARDLGISRMTVYRALKG